MKTIIKTVAVVALAVLTISIANGNPDERAQMMKASWLERLSQDGWQLTQETPSQLVVERRSGVMQTALMHMMSGANGTWAVDHLSVTFLPQSDHLTKFATNWSLNSQNAFGQMTSVPIKNRKTDAYTLSIVDWAAAQLPAKYRADQKAWVK